MNKSICLICLISIYLSSCGRGKEIETILPELSPQTDNLTYVETPFISADVPNTVISDTLQRIKGRWRKEIEDPRTPNPQMLELFISSNHELQGRLYIGSAYEDSGILITLTETGSEFSLTLIDDELREHDINFPKQRIFKGIFKENERLLELKSSSNEWMTFKFIKADDGGDYLMEYSGEIYQCTAAVPPMPPLRTLMTTNQPIAIPTAQIRACGLITSYNEKWARVSGAY